MYKNSKNYLKILKYVLQIQKSWRGRGLHDPKLSRDFHVEGKSRWIDVYRKDLAARRRCRVAMTAVKLGSQKEKVACLKRWPLKDITVGAEILLTTKGQESKTRAPRGENKEINQSENLFSVVLAKMFTINSINVLALQKAGGEKKHKKNIYLQVLIFNYVPNYVNILRDESRGNKKMVHIRNTAK